MIGKETMGSSIALDAASHGYCWHVSNTVTLLGIQALFEFQTHVGRDMLLDHCHGTAAIVQTADRSGSDVAILCQ